MLPRKARVPSRLFSVFQRQKGVRRVRGNLVSVAFGGTPFSSSARCACIVSKRVARTAVARNRLRRLCYAAIEPFYAKLPTGSIFLVFLQPPAREASPHDIQKEIRSIIERLDKMR